MINLFQASKRLYDQVFWRSTESDRFIYTNLKVSSQPTVRYVQFSENSLLKFPHECNVSYACVVDNLSLKSGRQGPEINVQPRHWILHRFEIICLFVVSAVHFAPYLTGLSSMICSGNRDKNKVLKVAAHHLAFFTSWKPNIKNI